MHINYGLHDLEGDNSTEHVDIAVYAANVVTLYQRWAARATSVIWASTTPVPNVTTSYGRTAQLAIDYNAAALAALTTAVGPTLLVDDLWAAVIAKCGAFYKSCPGIQLPANVHFAPGGQELLGEHAAASVLAALGM